MLALVSEKVGGFWVGGGAFFGKSSIPGGGFLVIFLMLALFHTPANRSMSVLHLSGKTKGGKSENKRREFCCNVMVGKKKEKKRKSFIFTLITLFRFCIGFGVFRTISLGCKIGCPSPILWLFRSMSWPVWKEGVLRGFQGFG